MKNRKSDRAKKDDGFTFAETIAVLAIMLILTAGTGFAVSKYVEKSRVVAAQNQIEIFKLALQSYKIDCGRYPTKEQGLEALWQKPLIYPVSPNWNGPYVDREIQKDPWGNDYVYSLTFSDKVPFTVLSYGADGVEGGNDEEADIVSWK